MFIGNDPASFHLWLKENFVKHRKVSKYCAIDSLKTFLFLFASLVVEGKFCKLLEKLKTFLLLFMLLVTTTFVKNSNI